ncbi:actin-like ATPase domain-containing protein [Ceraceosorus guamensis]|uniref:Actin-like ATPase domain-containing protein n=1 Tax=Ceraceosorus guamensis TaxID=1522189 RepID=A0A316VTW3_9BASI|nr:actin-like ATPase domain-containing protein [Ceraceosorus guamensis]PWN41027.1 actin-like ATPase domain-containing protein [Ceraceosorus guamensis]
MAVMTTRRTGRPPFVAMVLALALSCAYMLSHLCVAAMGVVGIDYGTESIKISLVKPGVPFDVVLSRDSKRKLPAAVAWKKQERLFGTDASNLATRFPGDTFINAKLLLGRTFDDADVNARAKYQSLLGTKLIPTTRDTCAVQRATDYTNDASGPDTYAVEELVAAQFSHARELAEEAAGEEFRRSYPGTVGSFGGLDVVITVPVYWTAAERHAIVDAARIAGFEPRLVSDGAAVGVNYAQTRTFPKSEKHLFYDAGAGSARATIVEFSTRLVQADSILSIGSTQKEAVIVDVLSAGWDRQASGVAVDTLIRDALADKFEETHGNRLEKPLRSQPRALARLLKEANRVKHVLSANVEASVNVEGLAEEIDFRSRFSREELERLVEAAGLTHLFASPVQDALKSAKLRISDLDSIVLVGGMSRVPFVQAALRAAGIPDSKIAQNVNADEAAVMGAAFYGATFNPQFRMKAIRAFDGNVYPVVLRESNGKEEIIYPSGSFEKTEHVRHYSGKEAASDFSLDIKYDRSVTPKLDSFDADLYRFEVVETDNYLAGLKERGELDQVDLNLNLTIISEPLGTYSIGAVWLNVTQKPGGIAGALKSFFNVGANAVDEEEEDGALDTNSTTADDAAANNSSAPAKTKKSKKALPTNRAIRLVGRAVPLGSIRPYSGTDLGNAKDRLYVANTEAKSRVAREEARNVLEASIYRARDIVHDEGFSVASKPKEREAISKKADELAEWLASRDGEVADLPKLKTRQSQLDNLIKPIEKRISEQRGRSAAITRLTSAMQDTHAFVSAARQNLTEALAAGQGSKYTVADLDTLEAQLKKDEKWYKDGETKQAKLSLEDDPVLKIADLEKRAKKLRDTIKRLSTRRIPKTRPPKKSSAAPPPSEPSASPGAESEQMFPPSQQEPASEPEPEPEQPEQPHPTQKHTEL